MIQSVVHSPQTVTVPIATLLLGESPRSTGSDEEHIARLAELDGPLPPILVDHGMRVVDGMHRLLAALSKGDETIDVEFFDGSADDAFLKSVEANVSHGLPLSRADRRAAAERIVSSHPGLSDRAIARSAGLSAKTVAEIRRLSTEDTAQVTARVGRDGKVRPLNSLEGRQRAAEVIAEHPQASLREVARLAGISPATVSDVRKRMAAGEPPAATRPEPSRPGGSPAPQGRVPLRRTVRRAGGARPDPVPVLEKLVRDPSLRHKEEGRQLLRLLQQNAMVPMEWSELAAAVPTHCGALVVALARQCAETWSEFAQELDERSRMAGQIGRAG
ncbi:transcriptional regulator [Kitasatospora sp. NPDC002227]|uniref:ParB/RepB/Spo0J family partition protein n=1 Tax=Kitasatospora sp. NPDC002227 TaxID=3154773 RepID=UPI00331AE435